MMFILSVYMGALTPALRWATGAGPLPPGDSDIGSTITQFGAMFVVTHWALRSANRMPAILKALRFYLVIIALCFLSVGWSGYPYNSLRRSVTLAVCVLYGAYLLDRLGLYGMVCLYTRTAISLALLSIALYVAVPSLGHDSAEGYEGALRGAFAAKNTGGMAMLLAIASLLYLGSLPGAKRARTIAGLLVAVVTLVMTKSATSSLIGAIIIGLGSRLWLRTPHARLLHNAAIAAVLLVAVFTVLFWPEAVLPAIGRDSSLTGRVPLWQESLKLIAQRPLLGYGYSGFWNADSRDVQYLWQVIGWTAPNAHDGYLDILLQIGVIGLVLYIFMWARIVRRAMVHVHFCTLREAPWILLFMTVNILLNIDEGPLPYPDEFTLFIAACLIVLSNAQSLMRNSVDRGREPWQGRPARIAARGMTSRAALKTTNQQRQPH